METKERIVDAREVFAEMSIKIDRAETWKELMEIIDSMDGMCSIFIFEASDLAYILSTDADSSYETLDEWRTLAETILAIPQSRGYYLRKGWLDYKALTDDDFDEVKELCRGEAKSLADWLCEDGRLYAKVSDK